MALRLQFVGQSAENGHRSLTFEWAATCHQSPMRQYSMSLLLLCREVMVAQGIGNVSLRVEPTLR